ncbi:MAG TPA: polysaccharide ABC transporter ATP-binding protein [Fimbriiglobus sp.]|nr:polysaccharide ABC transporter ATP-binding protein [Fimbriiglobus sp.]
MTAAIRVDGLGKCYRVAQGGHRVRYRTLRESLVGAVSAPFRRTGSNGNRLDQADAFWALKDVSFEVQPGEVVGIIGRNGAGKSTLLKVLSRITKPTTGRVEIAGRVGSLLEVGTGFHPELTGRENVYLNGSILGMSHKEIDRKFDEMVAFAEVEKFLDLPVKRYSSGMYVRLAFAVAAHLEPEILIVDEVLAVGDAAFQDRCLEKMRQCASSGRTVLLVSHQMTSVRDLCDRALWLDRGSVRQAGDVRQVIDRYMTETAHQVTPGTWIDLTATPRIGDGHTVFRSARFYGAVDEEPPVPDGPLHLAVRIDSEAESVAGHLRVEFQLHDRYRTRLLTFNTCEARQPLCVRGGLTELTFRVDRLHLAPGRYGVNLMMGDATDLYDSVSEAFQLEVVASADGDADRWGLSSLVTRTVHYHATPVDATVRNRDAL